MTFEKGWLKKQFDHVSNDIKTWPDWMQRERLSQYRARHPEPPQEPSTHDPQDPGTAAAAQQNKNS